MKDLLTSLNGKKTYLLAGLAAITIVINFITVGDFSSQSWMHMLQALFSDGALAALRAGVAKK